VRLLRPKPFAAAILRDNDIGEEGGDLGAARGWSGERLGWGRKEGCSYYAAMPGEAAVRRWSNKRRRGWLHGHARRDASLRRLEKLRRY
jgi:hypothetical protein